ncbi:MAG: zf-HC2 domain-containing protein [Betaproteobacteria bacterium]|nr:zf-HC2 domain-containing protein [Betaproteobacteria bacterium]
MPFDPSAHAAIDARLPFYVNGTLSGEELALIEKHVRSCERCQREVGWLREIFSALCDITLAQGTEPARPQPLATPERPPSPRHGRLQFAEGWRETRPWMRGLVAAQLAAIAVLATLLATDGSRDAKYSTLGAVDPSTHAPGAIAVIFDPGTPESEIRRAVRDAGARIVDGPTATHAYVLEVPATESSRAARALRGDRVVRFAQPLGPGTRP